MFQARQRATFLALSGPPNDPTRKHLQVIVTDPAGIADQVLMVPICTITSEEKNDLTCVLKPGDHEFISRKSYVAYAHARSERAEDIERRVESGMFAEKADMPPRVFKRIRGGFDKSNRVKPFVKDFL